MAHFILFEMTCYLQICNCINNSAHLLNLKFKFSQKEHFFRIIIYESHQYGIGNDFLKKNYPYNIFKGVNYTQKEETYQANEHAS